MPSKIPASLSWAKNAPVASQDELLALLKAASVGGSREADKLVLGFAGAILRLSLKFARYNDVEELFSEGLLASYRYVASGVYDEAKGGSIVGGIIQSAKSAIIHHIRMKMAQKRLAYTQSLDAYSDAFHEDEGTQLLRDVIADDRNIPADVVLSLNEDLTLIKKAAWNAMRFLSDKSDPKKNKGRRARTDSNSQAVAAVIKDLYLSGSNALTEAEIAKKNGVSREAIRRLKIAALIEIRMILDLPLPLNLPTNYLKQHTRYLEYERARMKRVR